MPGPLVPFSNLRIRWEESLRDILCEELECSTGDAQGIMEAQSVLIDSAYADRRDTPRQCATELLRIQQEA